MPANTQDYSPKAAWEKAMEDIRNMQATEETSPPKRVLSALKVYSPLREAVADCAEPAEMLDGEGENFYVDFPLPDPPEASPVIPNRKFNVDWEELKIRDRILSSLSKDQTTDNTLAYEKMVNAFRDRLRKADDQCSAEVRSAMHRRARRRQKAYKQLLETYRGSFEVSSVDGQLKQDLLSLDKLLEEKIMLTDRQRDVTQELCEALGDASEYDKQFKRLSAIQGKIAAVNQKMKEFRVKYSK